MMRRDFMVLPSLLVQTKPHPSALWIVVFDIHPNRCRDSCKAVDEHADIAPFIQAWIRLEEVAKLIQFFTKLQTDRVHPRYTTVVRTGRTSCSKPNIQQIPRSEGFREIFVPRDGHVFLTIDYAALELRTLAAECERRFGESVLADIIRAGTDPHAYTASLLLNMELTQFERLKESDPERFKTARQRAKAVNFGVPGGLGAASLSQYAQLNYGVNLGEEEAEEFRQRFLDQIYPEIGWYMQPDQAEVLAQNLHVPVRQVIAAWPEASLLSGAKNIVQGRTKKRDGTPYSERFIDGVWAKLRRLNQNAALNESLKYELAGPELEKKLFFGTVTTVTGRPRGLSTLTQRKNTPFQAMAADGAKIALWELFRAGYKLAAFVHDEFVIELPEDGDHTAEAKRIDDMCCRAMEQVTGTIPIQCGYVLSTCWSKQAEAVWDENEQLQVWRPAEKRDKPRTENIVVRSVPANVEQVGTPASCTIPIRVQRDKSNLRRQLSPGIEKLTQPLKWFGGKHYLASKIISLMPPHVHYVEPFFGGGSVLLQKPHDGISEVVNDRYGQLSNFWKVIADPVLFEQFYRRVEALPFSQQLWEESQEPTDDPVEAAVRFFVFARQSRAGQLKDFATLSRNRTRRGMNEQASAWLTAVAGLPQVHVRLKRVVVLCDEAVNVIRQQDGPNTLFYLDPPYLHETRTSTNEYAHEMTEADHRQLLEVLRKCKGKVLLSGYPSKLYNEMLHDWNRKDFQIDNKASGATTKRTMTECVWLNY